MFKTLRSRLLLSYIAVIITVLLVMAAVLFVIASRPAVRYFPTLQQLITISQSSRRELIRLHEADADAAAMQRALTRLARDNHVRILVADAGTKDVIFDSQETDSWVGLAMEDIDRRPQQLLGGVDRGVIFGRFRHPDGSSWLVYSYPLAGPERGRWLITYAQREPKPFAFFRELFLQPLVVAGLIAFLLAIMLALLIASSVARPLRRMAVATEAIAQGDYEQKLGLQGPEEVRRVAHSFNVMVDQVKTSQQAQRDFVANVSHDLKTPITSIRGWSQALLDGTAVSPGEQQRAIGVIHSEADRMARMVTNLLDLARIESGQIQLAREPVDLAQLLADVHHSFLPSAQEKQIHLTLAAQPTPQVLGDRDRLVQVLTNLVDNALAHTPEGGRVHLALRKHGDKAVEMAVQDTGRGIPEADLSRIFERFYQVDKSRARTGGRRGSGLGLAIVKELVEAHGGRILARSQEGRGSVFLVRLPISGVPEASTIMSAR
ncbi:MAG: sensor histidine kinase [Anaerolineae bacterium]